MPITLPPDYFGTVVPGFSALVQGFSQPLADVHDDVSRAYDAVTSADDGDVGGDLANLDGDSDVIATDVANEHTAVTSAATGDVLMHYATADGLTSTADRNAAAADPPATHGPLLGTPPELPPGLEIGQPGRVTFGAEPFDGATPPATAAPAPSPSPAPAASPAVNGGAAVGASPASAPVLFGTSDATAAGPDTTSTASEAPTQPGAQLVTHAQLQDILSQLEATIVVMV